MNDERKLLALRREVLAARSSMLRLRAAAELQSLRRGLAFHEIAGAVAGSSRARSIALTALVLLAGRRRIARIVRIAALAVGIAKAFALAGTLARRDGSAPRTGEPAA